MPEYKSQVSVANVDNPIGKDELQVKTKTGTNLDSNLNQVGGSSITLGQKSMTESIPVAVANDQTDVPTNVDQVGGSAITLGQKAMAESVPVAIANDQTTIPVNVVSENPISGHRQGFDKVVASAGGEVTLFDYSGSNPFQLTADKTFWLTDIVFSSAGKMVGMLRVNDQTDPNNPVYTNLMEFRVSPSDRTVNIALETPLKMEVAAGETKYLEIVVTSLEPADTDVSVTVIGNEA